MIVDYIWINNNSLVLEQIPHHFNSAAILLHPFVQMPTGWGQNHREDNQEPTYPTDEEILQYGKPVRWAEIISNSELTTFEELAVALKTSISAFSKEYAREDLAETIRASMKSDLYFPDEDFPTVFLVNNLLKLLGSKGAKQLSYSDPILDNSGIVELKKLDALSVSHLSLNEIMISDENMDFAFMNVFDSFTTILMTKDSNINSLVQSMDLEAVMCIENTYINWYSNAY